MEFKGPPTLDLSIALVEAKLEQKDIVNLKMRNSYLITAPNHLTLNKIKIVKYVCRTGNHVLQ